MRSFWFRVLVTAVLCVLSSRPMKSQSTPQPDSTLTDRCIRWLSAIVPDKARDQFNPTDFCLGYRTGNVDGLWSNCRPEAVSGRPPGHCGFMGRVMPGDTLAFSLITPSHDGHEFLASDAESGSDRQSVIATLYSRTDFVIDGLRLPAGLYRISPQKSGEDWEMKVARLKGEWNETVSPDQFTWRARMKSGDDVQSTEELIDQMWLSPKNCEGPSGVSSLREFEFRFGDIDISVCMNVIQELPLAGGQPGELDSSK